MKRVFYLLVLFWGIVSSVSSCEKEDISSFTIIGKWGMVSGSITEGDGSTKEYGSLGKDTYYQTLEFKPDGTLSKTIWPSGSISHGDYSFFEAGKILSYKFNGDEYYYSASIFVFSSREITITTDYGSAGHISQHFVKL